MILQYPGQRTFAIPGENWGVEFQRRWDAGVVASWWLSGGIAAANCTRAYLAKGAASLAASYINLPTPGTGDAAPGVAPGWDAVNGWDFKTANGKYLKTGDVLSGTNYSILVRFTNAGPFDTYFCGMYTVETNGVWLSPKDTTWAFFQYASISRKNSAGASAASGVVGLSGPDFYINGVYDSSGNGLAPTALEIYIGQVNISGSPYGNGSGKIQAYARYNIKLSAPQMLAVSTAMAAL